MTTEYNYTIEHPGEVFWEKLQELGMSVKEFAVRACKPTASPFHQTTRENDPGRISVAQMSGLNGLSGFV